MIYQTDYCYCIVIIIITFGFILAWFWGDPHFRTLDGRRYTFNGIGEYILADINQIFQLQARTGIAGNSSATIFTAFAFADTDKERIQVCIVYSYVG